MPNGEIGTMKLAWISLAALTFPASGLADQIAIRPDSDAAIAYSPPTGKYRDSSNDPARQAAADVARARMAADARIVCWADPPAKAAEAKPQPAKVAIGDLVDVYWKGSSYRGKVESTDFGLVVVKFTVNGKEVTDWFQPGAVTKAIINPEPSAVLNSPSMLTQGPPPKAEETRAAPGRITVGDQVEVTYLGAKVVGKVISAPEFLDIVIVEFTSFGKPEQREFKWSQVTRVTARPEPAGPTSARAPAADLPQARIGDTVAQCMARAGVRKIGANTLQFAESGWMVTARHYRGRVVGVTYVKEVGKDEDFQETDLLFLPMEPHIAALQKLNGGKSRWAKEVDDRGFGSKMTRYRRDAPGKAIELMFPTDVRWRTMEGLHFKFDIDQSEGKISQYATVSTTGGKGLDERTTDPIKMNRDDAGMALLLGVSLANIAGPFAEKTNQAEARRQLRSARRQFTLILAAEAARAADPEVMIPDLPNRTGDFGKDMTAFVDFLEQSRRTVLAAVGDDATPATEPNVQGCFDLGLTGVTVLHTSQPTVPKPKTDLLARLAAAGTHSNLPKAIWEPALAKARAGAPVDELTAVVTQMVREANRHLSARIAEWKPPAKPTEK